MSNARDLEEIRAILRREFDRLGRRYGVRTLELFGSYARRENRPESDLDLLATFDPMPSLLTLIAMEDELSDLLGVKVDLVLKDALKPRIGRRVLAEAVSI